MDPKEICERIDLASEIQSEVLGADLRIPDELAARMISTDTADEASMTMILYRIKTDKIQNIFL